MIINKKTEQIAYQSIRLRKDGKGTDLVQYDCNGNVVFVIESYTKNLIFIGKIKP